MLEMLHEGEIDILGVGDQVKGVERLYRSVPTWNIEQRFTNVSR
ncbi:hypothetical protein JCM19233_941 [Vibrio astriarenae]|nr:hypothetical protein JCM19233_941 [Vibrio sp. C7]